MIVLRPKIMNTETQRPNYDQIKKFYCLLPWGMSTEVGAEDAMVLVVAIAMEAFNSCGICYL